MNTILTTQAASNAPFTIRRNTLIHGDCVSVMAHIPSRSVDFILTDPPYLINYTSRDGRKVPGDNNAAWLKPAFCGMYRILRDNSFCVSFYSYRHADKFIEAYRSAGFRIVGHFTFPKRYTSSKGFVRNQHECAHLLVKGKPALPHHTIGDVIEWTYSGNKLHPTQKPIPILLPLIETFCPPKGLVLDPFAGSGTTLLAAHMTGRSYLGIELDANYHAIATKRLEAVA